MIIIIINKYTIKNIIYEFTIVEIYFKKQIVERIQ